MTTKTVTRRSLHSLVWSEQIDKAAESLGISEIELEKACDQLSVPRPYRGYWEMIEAGKAPAKLRLTPPSQDAPKSVSFGAPAQVAPAREQPAPKSRPPKPFTVKVPARLNNPHRIIAAWLEERRRDPWRTSPPAQTEIERRQLRLKDAIFKAVESRGHQVENERGSIHLVWLRVRGERIDFSFREKLRQHREPLSAEELKDPWNVSTNRRFKQVREPTGKLVLTAKSRDAWVGERTWSEAEGPPLEEVLDKVVLGLETLASDAVAYHEKRREEERIRWAEQAERAEQERLRTVDRNRWSFVRELAADWEEVSRLRRFLRALETAAQADDADVSTWLEWVREHIARMDPLGQTLPELARQTAAIDERSYERRSRGCE
jgi:hypothetical protein